MKLVMKCPCCGSEDVARLDYKLTGERIKELLQNKNHCQVCMKAGLGNVEMSVKKFDWEADLTMQQAEGLHVPVKLNTEDVTPEKLVEIKAREMKLLEQDAEKNEQ
jgi:hypothetical protein